MKGNEIAVDYIFRMTFQKVGKVGRVEHPSHLDRGITALENLSHPVLIQALRQVRIKNYEVYVEFLACR
jgi:hypothetical protein